jgi:flavodoxin
MNILIVFYSQTGNTKKVVDQLAEQKFSKKEIQIKNALTATKEHVEWADLILIGSPIHGFILFGQKFCPEVMKFINTTLSTDLEKKNVILFATFMFSPRNAMKKVSKIILEKNGVVYGTFARKRTHKTLLADELAKEITNFST